MIAIVTIDHGYFEVYVDATTTPISPAACFSFSDAVTVEVFSADTLYLCEVFG